MNEDLHALVSYRLEESLFHEHFVLPGTFDQDIARSLSVAFDLRNKSDYRELVAPSEEEASETLKSARGFVAEAERIIGE